MEKIKVGITVGDINGVGLEVILKTLSHGAIMNICTPVVYCSSKVVSYHKNIVGAEGFYFQGQKSAERLHPSKVNVINCWQENVNITLGQETEDGGKYAIKSLEWATRDLQLGLIDAIVTAPINKKAMQGAGFQYRGHTEYFTQEFCMKESLMLMVNDDLRIGLVTNHLPISEVAKNVTRERLIAKMQIMEHSLKKDFGIERPTIAFLGLNPHAGDGGVIGKEEEEIIRPVIEEAKKKGILAMGPFPADGFFGMAQYKKFDGILAMYHDQGLVPFKTLSFGNGVNYTAGLPIVRTSPDHGTGYDIAGKNEADPNSFRQALFLAVDIVRNRMEHDEIHADPLVKRKQHAKEDPNATATTTAIEEEAR